MTSSSDVSTLAERDRCEERCDAERVHAQAVAAARARTPGVAGLTRALELAAALSNPTRLRIVAALRGGPATPPVQLCVCDLAVVVAASETATSHQLRALRLAAVVQQQREGRLVYYRLVDDPLVQGVVGALLQGGA